MSKALSVIEEGRVKLGGKNVGTVSGGKRATYSKVSKADEELIRRITPVIEKSLEKKVTAHVIEALIDTLEQQNYPPEENLRTEFIEEVKRAEKGKFKKFKSTEEFRKYLSSL